MFVMGELERGEGRFASSRTAMARRCCLAIAVSFCWTMRRRLMASLSWTLILDTRDDEGAISKGWVGDESFKRFPDFEAAVEGC